MIKLLIDLWESVLREWELFPPRLLTLTQSYVDDLWARFPLGWFRPSPPPYFTWLTKRTWQYLDDSFNLLTDFLIRMPALAIAQVTIDRISIDKKLRQRVMTLEDAALFPAKVIIDLGLRQITEAAIPRELRLADLGQKVEELALLIKKSAGPGAFIKQLMGTVHGRVIKLTYFVIKWLWVVGYVVLLFRYVKLLGDESQWPRIFSAQLSNQAPRKREKVNLLRRVGGVSP